jgi:CDP-diacylglycerol--glycerol-3-phosphate 3-phosphatidyltransferase
MRMRNAANLITIGRALLALINMALFQLTSRYLALGGNIALTLVVIALDGLDGWVARLTGNSSRMGADLDIAADRVVENLYWVFFACAGLVSFWIPAIVATRGFATDFIRAGAARHGLTAFGRHCHLHSPLARAIVASRFSRAAYGAIKALAFVALGCQLAFHARAFTLLPMLAQTLAWMAVAFCLLRGVPVLLDAARMMRDDSGIDAERRQATGEAQ